MPVRFERHRPALAPGRVRKLHAPAKKGMALQAIARALTWSEESARERAKLDGLSIAKLQ